MVDPGRLRAILACPGCRVGLKFLDGTAACPHCGTEYRLAGKRWQFPPVRSAMASGHTGLGPKLSGRARRFGGTAWGQLYRLLYVHPARYIGDLQCRTGITNFHRRIQAFLEGPPRDSMVLDVGSGSRRLGPNVVTLDVDERCEPDIIADAHRIPILDEVCDAAIVQEVLEHTEQPETVLREVHRVLKHGAAFTARFPFYIPCMIARIFAVGPSPALRCSAEIL